MSGAEVDKKHASRSLHNDELAASSAQASWMNQLGMPSVEELLDLDGYLDAYLTQLQGQPVPQDPPYSSAGPMSHTATLPQQDQLLQHQALPHPLQHASAPLVGQNFVEPRNTGLPGLADMRLPSQLNQYQFSGLSNVALPSGLQAFTPGLAQPFTGMFADQHQPASLQQQVLPMQQQHTSRSSSKTQQVANAAHAPGTGRGGRGSKGRGAAKGGRDGGSGGRRSAKGRSEPDLSSSDAEEGGSDSAGSGSGDEVKRSRKPGPLDDGERRHLALQEKNRRAQRRFRERQKELTDKVSSLQGENTALHSRTNILEKVLDMRNEQIQVMQESKETAIYPAEEELGSLENVGGHLVQLTPESIKDLSSDAIYRIYQMYVKELSIRLADADKDAAASLRQPQLDLDTLVRDLHDDHEAGGGQAPGDAQVHRGVPPVPGQHRGRGHQPVEERHGGHNLSHVPLPACLPAIPSTRPSACTPSCLHALLPACPPACLQSLRHTHLPAHSSTCLPSCLQALLPSCPLACKPSCLLALLPDCNPSDTPSCLHALLPACPPACKPSYLLTLLSPRQGLPACAAPPQEHTATACRMAAGSDFPHLPLLAPSTAVLQKLIDLSTDQKQEVVELKRLFLTKIEPIMEERKHLNIQIQANLPHDTFHTKNALTYIKAHEAVIKLRDNLKAEQHVVLEFAIAVFRGVF
ncbi:BZIP domain-containing protein, partial [Haematococcus lacustris]